MLPVAQDQIYDRARRGLLTWSHVLEERVIAVPTFIQCLPYMLVPIYKSRANDFVGAIDDLNSRGWGDSTFDTNDHIPLYEDV